LIDFLVFLWTARQRMFAVFSAMNSLFKTSAQLRLENVALRQQLAVLRRSAPKQLKLKSVDRIFWVCLRRVWRDWRSALMNRQARDGRRLAPEGLPLVLDLEDKPRQAGSAESAATDS
jgi:hypothetical protein